MKKKIVRRFFINFGNCFIFGSLIGIMSNWPVGHHYCIIEGCNLLERFLQLQTFLSSSNNDTVGSNPDLMINNVLFRIAFLLFILISSLILNFLKKR